MRHWIHTLLLFIPLAATAQEVTLCPGWWATVDEETQQIVLGWHPSPDSSTRGYYICTGTPGTPCVDYDTVFGRLDTSYICIGHSPLEQHIYGLHVFDTTNQASRLTPFFGNMVLTAVVPECETDVQVSWTPYQGLPEGIPHYQLWAKLEPEDSVYDCLYITSDSNELNYSLEIPESVTYAWFKVVALGDGGYRSLSNVVKVERRTINKADFLEISQVSYDSIRNEVALSFHLDTSFHEDHYTLYRSIDGRPWHTIGTFHHTAPHYTDPDINIFDSLHCYQIGVLDACGMNEQRSDTVCVVVPSPPAPRVTTPNALLFGDPENGVFLPIVDGLKGDLYELSIYNRFGILVFHTNRPTEGWTPTSDTPQGVYAYHLRCRFNTGFIQNYTGTFVLIK